MFLAKRASHKEASYDARASGADAVGAAMGGAWPAPISPATKRACEGRSGYGVAIRDGVNQPFGTQRKAPRSSAGHFEKCECLQSARSGLRGFRTDRLKAGVRHSRPWPCETLAHKYS